MIQEMWRTFPRVLEQNINSLLDDAYPIPTKAFRIYKACKREDLFEGNFEKFSRLLDEFFSRPKMGRKKSAFDANLKRPMHQNTFADFHIDFRTAVVNETSLINIASWSHNLMRVAKKSKSVVISLEVMTKTLRQITHPGPFDKAEDIEFEDFCTAWSRTVFKLFGKQHDTELAAIQTELRWLYKELLEEEEQTQVPTSFPTIYLTQTETRWVMDLRKAAADYLPAPKFPLARGPQKQRLLELERVARLYQVVQTTNLPELIKHRDNIRVTLLDRCDRLLEAREIAA
jgi:hypothetical protein